MSMKCPACNNLLTPHHFHGMTLDSCKEVCGGIWFEAAELDKVGALTCTPDLRFVSNMKSVIDRSRERVCPKCPSHLLTRVHHDNIQELELDECPRCHGWWIDLGELSILQRDNQLTESIDSVLEQFRKKYAQPDRSLPKGIQAVMRFFFKESY